MRIITKKAIMLFYMKHADSKTALEEWYSKTHKADWNNFAEIKKDFKTVDAIGNNRFVFNIKGNQYRLVVIIIFKIKMVYIRFIGSHALYDKTDCKNI
jgi:mRNA interferase HigB